MAARIFRNIVLTALISVLLTAGIIMISMYTVYEERISSDLKLEAGYIRHALELTENDTEYLKGLGTENRITLIDAEGTVLFDNRASHAQMENHSGRPEIIAALEQGYGMSTRNSDTQFCFGRVYQGAAADDRFAPMHDRCFYFDCTQNGAANCSSDQCAESGSAAGK